MVVQGEGGRQGTQGKSGTDCGMVGGRVSPSCELWGHCSVRQVHSVKAVPFSMLRQHVVVPQPSGYCFPRRTTKLLCCCSFSFSVKTIVLHTLQPQSFMWTHFSLPLKRQFVHQGLEEESYGREGSLWVTVICWTSVSKCIMFSLEPISQSITEIFHRWVDGPTSNEMSCRVSSRGVQVQAAQRSLPAQWFFECVIDILETGISLGIFVSGWQSLWNFSPVQGKPWGRYESHRGACRRGKLVGRWHRSKMWKGLFGESCQWKVKWGGGWRESREDQKKYLITHKTPAVEHGKKGYRKIAISMVSRTISRKATVGHTGRGFRPRSNFVSGINKQFGIRQSFWSPLYTQITNSYSNHILTYYLPSPQKNPPTLEDIFRYIQILHCLLTSLI